MTDVREVMQKLSKANKLMEGLIDTAMADEEITEEEKQMLFSINDNLAAYAKLIVETVTDGVVDEDEKARLKELEKKIVSDAHEIAREDSNVSDDERTMLSQLIKTVQAL